MSPWSGGHDGATGPPEPTPEALAFRESLGGVFPDHVAIIMDGNGRWAQERGAMRELILNLIDQRYGEPQ